jgi:hypothetical protein
MPFPNQDMRAQRRLVPDRLGMAQLVILRLGLKKRACVVLLNCRVSPAVTTAPTIPGIVPIYRDAICLAGGGSWVASVRVSVPAAFATLGAQDP